MFIPKNILAISNACFVNYHFRRPARSVRVLATPLLTLLGIVSLSPSLARSQEPAELKKELQAIKEEYALRIATLEERIAALEKNNASANSPLSRRPPQPQ